MMDAGHHSDAGSWFQTLPFSSFSLLIMKAITLRSPVMRSRICFESSSINLYGRSSSVVDGYAVSWAKVREKRREMIGATRAATNQQPALFEMYHDPKPQARRTAVGRYHSPSLFDWITRWWRRDNIEARILLLDIAVFLSTVS
jgi:hypothetical protein